MNSSLLALLGTVVWVGGLGMGMQMSTKVDKALRSQVEDQLARVAEPAELAPTPEKKPDPRKVQSLAYWNDLAGDAKSFGVRAPSKKRMSGAQSYRRWIKKTRKLRIGKKLRKGPLEMRASFEPVRFMRQGAFVKSRHTVLILRNRSNKAVAYRIDARAHDRGRCAVKGTRQHNAVALMPKQSAEITICAGKSAVQIGNLETLELSRLGYHYLSRVPPQALGVQDARASAHVVPQRGRVCAQLQNGQLAKALREGKTRWADIADYYSRHNCSRFVMPEKYRRARRRLKRLPILAQGES